MIGSSSNQPDVMGSEDEPNALATVTSSQDQAAEMSYPMTGKYFGQDPCVGMKFDSHEEARQFYNDYARRKGFGTRKGKTERSRVDRAIISRMIVCRKEGFRDKKHTERTDRVRREQEETRVGCKAHILVKRRKEGDKQIWVIDRYEAKHNHELLSPMETIKLRSHRGTAEVLGAVIDNMKVVQTPDGQMYHVIAPVHGGLQQVPFSQRGIYNCSGQIALAAGDAQAVVNYCSEMQGKNPNFYHSIQVDDEGRISHFFWVDARSVIAYKYFGDVVDFDTTYRTSLFDMPFCIFTGMNHHRQTVMFGAALLCDETEASFSWLFSTWLQAMSWKPPSIILTDQDVAVAKAIARVMPTTMHHICRWRILEKVPENLGHICRAYPEFQGEFDRCHVDIEAVDEFEMAWQTLISKYELQQNEWLKSLYDIRQQWIPAYTRWVFTAGMSTKQYSESKIAFFCAYLRRNMTLQEFVRCYDEALDARYNQESEFDRKNLNTEPSTRMSVPMLCQVAPLYTRANLLLFEQELDSCFKYVAEEVGVDGLNKMYRLKNFEKEDARWHFVTFNASETKATCSCLKFESEGIFCRHILKVMVVNNVMGIPTHYILERWTMNAKTRVVYDYTGMPLKSDWRKSEILRYNDLFERARRCAEEGTTLVDIYDAACASLQRCLEEIVMVKKSITKGKLGSPQPVASMQGSNVNLGSQIDMPINQMDVLTPQTATSKGHPHGSSSRNEGHVEKRSMKTCSVCKGKEHNSRTCPQVKGTRAMQFPQRDYHPNIEYD